MKAVILAGGFGTRLKEVVKDFPKPMAIIMGKPFLEHQIRFLKEHSITEIIIAVHHMADKIKSYFGNGSRFGVEITYSEEDVALGTAGAIKKAKKYLDNTFIVLNGDSYSQINLNDFLDFHKLKKSNATMSLTKSQNPFHYGRIMTEEDKIIKFSEKGDEIESNLVNSGIYIFEPRILDYIEDDKNISLEKDIFPKLAQENILWGYQYNGYFMDIGRPETYGQFKKDVLNTLIVKKDTSIKNALNKIDKSGINIILVIDDEGKLLGVVNEKITKWHFLKGGHVDDNVEIIMIKDPVTGKINDNPSRISELFLSGIHHLPIVDEKGILRNLEFHMEKIKIQHFPVVRGKSPLRISFAGGGTDVSYFFEEHGGVVINSTINKYCHATIIRRADSKIIINSEEEEIILDSKNLEYDGKFNLVKAIINKIKPDFGFELYLHNDIPPGRGLGSSASLSVLIIKLLSQLQGKEYGDDETAKIAYEIEHNELGIKGGWQDQYAAVTGGFNFMEFSKNKKITYPLRLKRYVMNELNSRLILCYVGSSHFSGDLHETQEKTFFEDEKEAQKRLEGLKKIAIDIKDSLLTGDVDSIGRLLHESWKIKRKTDKNISNMRIDELYNIGIKNGASGGKLLGAGGGGYLLFFHSPRKRNQLVKALKKACGEIMDFEFEFEGIQTWNF